ncbi:hypothetical protein [Nocardioides sp.]|uniref:hypothetical protein n=1 Tax=Nocardioides sp. TaxID=35761 RepID=UPI003511A2B9
MPRRVSLPAADDLFRPTSDSPVRAVPDAPEEPSRPSGNEADAPPVKGPSGRVRHDEKITVYVTSAELMELEQARLRLRGEHGLAVDRGRLVREALHLVLADLGEQGEDSALVRRLRE